MRKTRKWLIISAVLALCVSVCACLFVGCTETPEGPLTYTVTVQTENQTPASGVKVQLKKGTTSLGDPVTTGTDGKAEFEAAPDTYTVALSSLPTYYHLPQGADVTMTKNNPTLTVTLEKDSLYTVNLVKPDGTPYYAQGVSVGICDESGQCKTPVALGTDGVAIIKGDPANYHVQVLGLPANTMIELENGYYAGETFTATKKEMNITVYEVVTIDLAGTAMTTAAKTAYAQANTSFDANIERDSFMGTKTLTPGDAVYFSVTATSIRGFYGFYNTVNDDLSYSASWSGGSVSNGQERILEAANTYLIKAKNNGTKNVDASLVVAVPFTSYIEKSGTAADDVTLILNKENYVAVVAFTPSEGGTYKLAVNGGVEASASASTESPDEVISQTPSYTAGAEAEYSVSAKSAARGIVIYFTVAVKTNPASIVVVITQEEKSSENYTFVEVEETLTKYTKPENKELFGIPMDGTAEDLVKGDDGFYHYGTADGPVVVVNITGELERARYDLEGVVVSLITLDTVTNEYVYAFTTQNGNVEDTLDYQLLLRGFTFEEYEIQQQGWRQVYVVPSEITTETYYAKYVNSDGMYPLTEELKTFLEKFYTANKPLIDWATYDAQGAWLFPCYYYGEPTVADPIVGEYKFAKKSDMEGTVQVGDTKMVWSDEAEDYVEGTVTADDYKLIVNKNGSFMICAPNYEGEYEEIPSGFGTWKKSGQGYIFTVPGGGFDYNDETGRNNDLVYTVTFESGKITLVGDDGDDMFPATKWEFVSATQEA